MCADDDAVRYVCTRAAAPSRASSGGPREEVGQVAYAQTTVTASQVVTLPDPYATCLLYVKVGQVTHVQTTVTSSLLRYPTLTRHVISLRQSPTGDAREDDRYFLIVTPPDPATTRHLSASKSTR